MVVSCSRNAERFFPAPLSIAGANAEGVGVTQNRGAHIPVGRLACLREKFRNNCLLTEASNLMLASWRAKSSQTQVG